MPNSYTRLCRCCSRRISMRQMPAGQCFAFEGDSVHDCARPVAERVTSPPRRTPPPLPPAPEFEDFEMRPEASAPAPPVSKQIRVPTPPPELQPKAVKQKV